MNLTKLRPAWNQFKTSNSLIDINEAEILSAIEPKKSVLSQYLAKRVVQNIFAYSFLILTLNGGCSI